MHNKLNFILFLLVLGMGIAIISYATGNIESAQQLVTASPAAVPEDMRLALLEKALAPKTPLSAVKTWAEGVKQRNGALQFAVFTEHLRKQKYDEFAGLNWTTGTSSPWVKSYTITKESDNKYHVEFLYTDSTGASTTECQAVTVMNVEETWLISNISGC